MKPEKYISLPLAKKIAEVAKEKGIELPESEYWHTNTHYWNEYGEFRVYYYDEMHIGKKGVSREDIKNEPFSIDYEHEYEKQHEPPEGIDAVNFPAHDTFELGEILPKSITHKGDKYYPIEYYSERGECRVEYKNFYFGKYKLLTLQESKTEPEARGKMLLYLLENDIYPQSK